MTNSVITVMIRRLIKYPNSYLHLLKNRLMLGPELETRNLKLGDTCRQVLCLLRFHLRPTSYRRLSGSRTDSNRKAVLVPLYWLTYNRLLLRICGDILRSPQPIPRVKVSSNRLITSRHLWWVAPTSENPNFYLTGLMHESESLLTTPLYCSIHPLNLV